MAIGALHAVKEAKKEKQVVIGFDGVTEDLIWLKTVRFNLCTVPSRNG